MGLINEILSITFNPGVIIAIVVAALIGISLISWAIVNKTESKKQIQQDISNLQLTKAKLEQRIEDLKIEQEKELRHNYEVKNEGYAAAYEAELIRTLKQIKEEYNIDEFEKEIQQYKATIDAINQENLRRADSNFETQHRILLSENDKRDISLIKEIEHKLSRPDILPNVLWTIYYQKPLQELRTKLFGKMTEKICGIYKITSISENKVYIGQAKNISERFTQHVKAALFNEQSKFYKAMAEQGPENFTFEIMEICEEPQLNEREKYWIALYDSVKCGYNTQAGG